MPKWNKYTIDYGYGYADLCTVDKLSPENATDMFYHLAYQCFGIRKSIGEVKLVKHEENWEGFDYVNPDAKFILCQSGDTIIWGKDTNVKLKSEWDD